MPDVYDTPAPAPSGAWKRYVWIGVGLLAVVGVAVFFLLPTARIDYWIGDLGTTNQKQLEAGRARLRESTHPKTDDLLAEAVADGGRPFLVRERSAELLLLRNRLVTVENLARTGDLMTRAVALRTLSKAGRDHFLRDYVPDPSYQVETTVRAWLADSKLEARSDAVSLAIFIGLKDAMEHVRPLLDRARVEGAGKSDANATLQAAVNAAVQYKDCASLPAIAVLADGDMEWEVRRAALEAMVSLAVGVPGSEPPCPTGLPEGRVPTIITRLLDGAGNPKFARNLRMKGLILIEHHPVWLPANAKRVWEILDGDDDGAVRREALAALVSGKDPGIAAVFPRYLHDRAHEVRSTAVQAAPQVEGVAPESLWIGILRDEMNNFVAVWEAHASLKRAAGAYLGLPEALTAMRNRATEQNKEIERFVQELMQRGTSMGKDREAWAETWFRWYAERLGLTGESQERAVAARKKFRQAMNRDDAAAAKAALAEVPDAPLPLFLYEQAWLATRN
jgi:hypothetical protein